MIASELFFGKLPVGKNIPFLMVVTISKIASTVYGVFTPHGKWHASCFDTDVGVAAGSMGSEEKAGFAIHCHGVKRTAGRFQSQIVEN